MIVDPSGVDRLEARANAVEAFAWEVNAAYVEQEHDGPRYGLSREDLRYCWQLSKHANARWQLALYEELHRRWGKPADANAAAKLPIPPWQQTLLLGDRPSIPLDPSREPHAVPDIPNLVGDWQGAVRVFLEGRRNLLVQLGGVPETTRGPTRPVGSQRTFIEASQPREREDDVEEVLERFDRAVDDLGVVDPRPEREPGEDDDVGEDEDPDPQLH